MPEWIIDPLVYFAGAALIGAAVRRWVPQLPIALVVVFTVLAAGFFAGALASDAHQVPTDIARSTLPWSQPGPHGEAVANPLLQDPITEFLPWRHLVRERLLAFEAPLWSPQLGCGQPLAGNAQSAPYSPLHLAAIALPPLRALTVTAAWTLLLAMVLTGALVTHLGGRPEAAALAGAAFGLSTFMVLWVEHPHSAVAAWLPGILLGISKVRAGSRGGIVGLTLCGAGAILGGHPATLMQVAWIALLVAGWSLAVRRREAPSRAAAVARWAVAGLLAVSLGAPALVPFVEALPEAQRSATMHRRGVAATPYDPGKVALALVPRAEGSPLDGTWEGRSNLQERATASAGLVVSGLALGVVAGGGFPAVVMGGGVSALLGSSGVPGFAWLGRLPGIAESNPTRLHWLFGFATAVAAGLALERILAGDRRVRLGSIGSLLVVGIAALCIGVVPGIGRVGLLGVSTAGAAVTAFLLASRRLRAAAGLALLLTVGELGVQGWGYHPTLPATRDLAPTDTLRFLVDALGSDPSAGRVMAEGMHFPAAVPGLFGLSDPRGNDPMRSSHLDALLQRTLAQREGWRGHRLGFRPIDREGQTVLDLLGVRYALLSHDRSLRGPWRKVFVGERARVWENPWALPLFRVAEEVRVVPAGVGVVGAVASETDFAARTWALEGAAATQRGRVESILGVSNGFDVEVVAESPALVSSSVTWARAWSARSHTGVPLPVERVDAAFVGVRVPAGPTRIELRYRPRGWTAAWVASLLALAIVVAVTAAPVLRLGRDRRFPGDA